MKYVLSIILLYSLIQKPYKYNSKNFILQQFLINFDSFTLYICLRHCKSFSDFGELYLKEMNLNSLMLFQSNGTWKIDVSGIKFGDLFQLNKIKSVRTQEVYCHSDLRINFFRFNFSFFQVFQQPLWYNLLIFIIKLFIKLLIKTLNIVIVILK